MTASHLREQSIIHSQHTSVFYTIIKKLIAKHFKCLSCMLQHRPATCTCTYNRILLVLIICTKMNCLIYSQLVVSCKVEWTT